MAQPLTQNIRPGKDPLDRKGFEQVGGYQALRQVIGSMTPAEVSEVVKTSGLKGRGGAGFPTGLKWSFVPTGADVRHPTYLIANADEMEPGTFKDRLLLEGNPHQLIEAIVIAAYAVQADIAYIFLRWAYHRAAELLTRAMTEAHDAGYVGANILGSGYNLELRLHVGAGRYICGEETGLLNSLEGRRATPRAKPPFPQMSGLWGRATVVNNVETLVNLPHIINNGAEWFKGLSLSPDSGTKLYGISGRVKQPGVWELPMGTPVREILEGHADGMRDGYKVRGFLPGGAATQFMLAEHLDVHMDFRSVLEAGSRLGTGAIIVLDDQTCPVGMVLSIERFYARESCGWCTPCRDGLPWTVRVLEALEQGRGQPGDLETLERHARLLGPGRTFCALAPGAMEPLLSALKYFRQDFERHIREKRCPWRR